jgi:hypothetical protein
MKCTFMFVMIVINDESLQLGMRNLENGDRS